MELPDAMKGIIADFVELKSRTDKYEELLSYGDELQEMQPEFKTKENLVPGCTSVVYIKTIVEDNKLIILGDADSYLVKGLVAVFAQGFTGMQAKDFLEIEPDFIRQLGLTETLSATRANASINIFNMIKKQAKEQL